MSPVLNPGHYLKIEDVSKQLNTPVPTIRQWAKSGRLAYHKPGKSLLFSQADVDKFMAQHRCRPDAELNAALAAKRQELKGGASC